MKIIVPMAGMGKRLRPHTLTTAKPLLPIAGQPIVQRLVQDIVQVSNQKVDEIAYVVGRFGTEVEQHLIDVAASLGAKGTIHYQDQPLGTAHAILCAKSALEGPVTVAFADTLFTADFQLDQTNDGVLWVQKIDDPRQFGVVSLDPNGIINDFVEKPEHFVSDLAMIGIYYFKDGAWLRDELQYLIDNGIMNSNEYQLPDALRNMVKKGAKFTPGTVNDWMDCGNKEAMVETNSAYLRHHATPDWVSKEATIENCTIIAPCFIEKNSVVKNSVIGPGVSIGAGAVIERSVISESIVQSGSAVKDARLHKALIGRSCVVQGQLNDLSLGDFSKIVI
jgi:glucose-1-phosphate thymidylyltransferase